jgi:hypothetical protein
MSDINNWAEVSDKRMEKEGGARRISNSKYTLIIMS